MKRIIHLIFILFLVYSINAQSWTQIGQNINGEGEEDFSGWSVSLNAEGNIVAIGAPEFPTDSTGYVRVFENIEGTWEQKGQVINGSSGNDESGYSISLNAEGNILIIGSWRHNEGSYGFGEIRVFKFISVKWVQIGQSITGEGGMDFFGFSVSINDAGNIIAAGAPESNGDSPGYVKIYENINDEWVQLGDNIIGEEEYGDRSGYSISLNADGSIIAIGDDQNQENGFAGGHVRVFENINGIWEQLGGDLDAIGMYDSFGCSVSLSSDGHTLAVGAHNAYNSEYYTSGHVRVFRFVSDNWEQIGQAVEGNTWTDYFGGSIQLNDDGSILVVGSLGNWCTEYYSGKVEVFKNLSEEWNLIGEAICGEFVSDEFGRSVSINGEGSIIAGGADGNNGGGYQSGNVRLFMSPIMIFNQPENEIGFCEDEIVQISVDGLNIDSYDWQLSTNNGSSWISLNDDDIYSGSNTHTLCIMPDLSMEGYQYSCIVSNDNGSLISNTGTLVHIEETYIVSQPQSLYEVELGSEVSFSVDIVGCNLTYQWRKDGTDLENADVYIGVDTKELTILSVNENNEGLYDCYLTSDNENIFSDLAELSLAVNIKELSKNQIHIYPNPTNGILNIRFNDNSTKQIIISNIAGKIIIEKLINTQKATVDLTEFNKGIYILSIKNEKTYQTKKILKI